MHKYYDVHLLQPQSMLGRNVNIRLGINHLGFHIVIAEDNVSYHLNFATYVAMKLHIYFRFLIKHWDLKGQNGVFLLKLKKSLLSNEVESLLQSLSQNM